MGSVDLEYMVEKTLAKIYEQYSWICFPTQQLKIMFYMF